jgi:hypothetical protein
MIYEVPEDAHFKVFSKTPRRWHLGYLSLPSPEAYLTELTHRIQPALRESFKVHEFHIA